MQMVKASFQLGPQASSASIDRVIDKAFDTARKAFGDRPSRAMIVIDRTGYNTVVRAMVAPLVVA